MACKSAESWPQHKRDEARRLFHSLAEEPKDFGVVEDGFGSCWARCKEDCGLQVVRPGKVQWECDCQPEDSQESSNE